MAGGGDDELHAHARTRIGRVLHNKWRLDALLGVGGMAAVYAATHRNANRAAVKVLHDELSGVPEVRTRFLREGYVANTIAHPGAVRVLDDDADADGTVFLVMELLEGETLAAHWQKRGRRIPPLDVSRIADRVLDVLGAAHGKGIVHRDVKPENIFLTNDGGVKLLDFGFARVLDAASTAASVTGIHTTLGTPGFMSPEQAAGKWNEVDARSDLWALGATMFALASGREVHEGRTVADVLVAAATKPARSLRLVAPMLPAKLIVAVDRALAFEKRNRWPSAQAMQAAVRLAVGLPDDEATNPDRPEPPRPAPSSEATIVTTNAVAAEPMHHAAAVEDLVSETMVALHVDATGAPISGVPRISQSNPNGTFDAAPESGPSSRVIVETLDAGPTSQRRDPLPIPQAPLPRGFRPPSASSPFWEQSSPGAPAPVPPPGPPRSQIPTSPAIDMRGLGAAQAGGGGGRNVTAIVIAGIAGLVVVLVVLVGILLAR
jgi:serine/threonine-protein kinase